MNWNKPPKTLKDYLAPKSEPDTAEQVRMALLADPEYCPACGQRMTPHMPSPCPVCHVIIEHAND